jgi:hypothetical protein
MAVLTIGDEVYELLRELSSALPDGTAVLTRQRSKDPAGGEDIKLTPADPSSARISLHPAGDIIYAAIGRNTTMEFFVSSRRQEERELANLRKISRAVIEGKFSEDVWILDGKIVKSSGVVETDGRRQRIGRFLNLFNPLRRKQKNHYDYAPYLR